MRGEKLKDAQQNLSSIDSNGGEERFTVEAILSKIQEMLIGY
ncbi:hypothetical protein MNV_910005 [Candidatus Methanoperedens nitroreducens]|uniref:Uncharacterized protein n=1 Tax=Candidatus Methanoperedens nitratireducens TaxID=1392998 RepID=A0A284VU60_9EURY|nr:hypothetical protein MNV_910005 [Candidatus Methanoperedens nitroreducens]